MKITNRHTLTRFIRFSLLLLAVAALLLPMFRRYAAAEPAAVSGESKIYLPLVVKQQLPAAVQNANFENGRHDGTGSHEQITGIWLGSKKTSSQYTFCIPGQNLSSVMVYPEEIEETCL